MAATNSLVASLQRDYPTFRLVRGDTFRWEPAASTVHIGSLRTSADRATLLHEIGHAICGHQQFDYDVELIRMEREAWTKAVAIAPTYLIEISDEFIESALDSYRDWLDARSRCPSCHQSGIQDLESTYTCLICHLGWRVNDARQCGLKRYTLSRS